jgi:hypothetical protein
VLGVIDPAWLRFSLEFLIGVGHSGSESVVKNFLSAFRGLCPRPLFTYLAYFAVINSHPWQSSESANSPSQSHPIYTNCCQKLQFSSQIHQFSVPFPI